MWQRPTTFSPVVGHYPLGDSSHPGAVPPVRGFSSLPFAARASRQSFADDPVLVVPVPVAGQSVPLTVPRRDRYAIWLAGSTRAHVDVLVDGRRIGGAGYHLNNLGQFVELADAVLVPGAHTLELRFVRPRAAAWSGRARLRPQALSSFPLLPRGGPSR